MKLEVGQTIYLKPINNAARYVKDMSTAIVEVKITKVAKKYFYIDRMEEYENERYNIETMYRDDGQYSSEWKAYTSR